MNPREEDHRTLALWAADCAERVLPYFEEKRPEDDRPRKAIEAARAWARGEIKVGEARTAAFAVKAVAHASTDTAAEEEREWRYRRLSENLRTVAFPGQDDD